MKRKSPKIISFGAIIGLIVSMFASLPARAVTGIGVDFAGAQPTTYSHLAGGGAWNSGTVNVDIARSLEGEAFACNDIVSYLTKIDVPNSLELRNMGAMTAQIGYSFDLDTTGQSGVALSTPITASINTASDSATKGDNGSSVSLVSTSTTGPEFTSGSKLLATFNITDLEANETIVMRINVKLRCKFGAKPTGNLQAKLIDSFLIYKNGTTPINPPDSIGTGAKTIDLKSTNLIATPQLVLQKTVTFGASSCPGVEFITIKPDDYVKYCYKVTNPSNVGSSAGAPVFNVSTIADDSGDYPDFTVTLTSGLTDIDGDGQADDLAPGAVALGEKVLAFDGNKDTTLLNTAVVTGKDAPIDGNTLTATDTATIFIDAPEPVPGISIQKTPDAQTVLEGSSATFTISVQNTGNVELTNVAVTDALTPNCDKSWSTLAVGATETYTCTTSSLLAPFTNTAVVVGYYLTTPVTAQDIADVAIDYLPKIEVTKTASVASVPETGGSVTFTVLVKNLAVQAFTLNSLIDDKFGDLNGEGTCTVPQTIAVAGEYSCTFTKTLTGDDLVAHKNIVTASGQDPEGNQTSANDDATVTFEDILPDVSLTKSVNPTTVKWSGDYVDYHFVITNLSTEKAKITAFTDNKVTLSAQCVALIGTWLDPGAKAECDLNDFFVTGGGSGGPFTNTASVTVEDNDGNSDSAESSATVVVDAPDPKITISKTPDTQTVVEGEIATFTITVKNTGNVPLTDVVVTDVASTNCNNSWGTLAIGQEITYTCTTAALFGPFTNTAVVVGYFTTTQVTAQDSADVLIDYLPKIQVVKTPSVGSVPETGGSVTFTVVVKNLANEDFTLNSLVDDKFGNLNGVGTCTVPQTIVAAGQYSCSFTKTVASDTLTPHINIVTATGKDPQNHETSANDDATVNFTDVLPDITLTKTVNPTAARWTGDYVDYHFVIKNLSAESVKITSFTDNAVSLSAQCLALIDQWLAPGASVDCYILGYYVTGTPGGSFTNTATVVAKDNENNSDSATANAVVNFWWYGRTPGYWKSHPEAWISGYTPTMKIQDIFVVPNNYLSGTKLDLDKNGVSDDLMAGLGYKGGTNLAGGAQILFRAAIAALLNEAYYGADYPGATSKAALINQVNAALATLDRAQLISLASYFDYWNNAVHASLP